MKLLIAVKSCGFDRGRGAHDLARETWGKDTAGVDLVFFVGAGVHVNQPDEIELAVPDTYAGLPIKTKAICEWALSKGYDYAFLTDTGSFLVPHHIVAYDYGVFDYLGYWGLKPDPFYFEAGNTRRGCPVMAIQNCYPWASGGGFYLSRRAMEIVVKNEPVFWAEDCSVSQVLAKNGIFLEDRAKDGYFGYIVSWIHNENNYRSDSMLRRTRWMKDQYEEAKRKCAEGCDGPLWNRVSQMRKEEAR